MKIIKFWTIFEAANYKTEYRPVRARWPLALEFKCFFPLIDCNQFKWWSMNTACSHHRTIFVHFVSAAVHLINACIIGVSLHWYGVALIGYKWSAFGCIMIDFVEQHWYRAYKPAPNRLLSHGWFQNVTLHGTTAGFFFVVAGHRWFALPRCFGPIKLKFALFHENPQRHFMVFIDIACLLVHLYRLQMCYDFDL